MGQTSRLDTNLTGIAAATALSADVLIAVEKVLTSLGSAAGPGGRSASERERRERERSERQRAEWERVQWERVSRGAREGRPPKLGWLSAYVASAVGL